MLGGNLWSFQHSAAAAVSPLVRRNLNTTVNLVFEDDWGWLIVADVAIKSFKFRVVAVYAPNSIGKRHSFF